MISLRGRTEKMHFVVDKDIEAGASAGAGKMFQIACLSIEDPDRTKLIDRGRHFLSDEELREYISGRSNIPLANTDLIAE